jgi:hypothetical protein
MSLLVAVFFTGSFSENLAFAKVDEKQVNAIEQLLNDLIATVENLANIIAQLQADVTELKDNEASSVSPVYVNSEIITTAASDISTYTMSCNVGDVAQSGNLIKLENPKRFIQVLSSYNSDQGSWEFQLENTHEAKSLDAELSITCLRS